MSDGSAALVEQFHSNMAESCPRLHRCCPVVIQGDPIHAIKRNHKVTIFAAKGKRAIAVAAALGTHPHTILDSARNRRLDLVNGRRDGDGSWRVSQAKIVRLGVLGPLGRILDRKRDAGVGETGGQSIPSGKEDSRERHSRKEA